MKEQDEPIVSQNSAELNPEIPGKSLAKYGNPDIITEHYIVECKLGEKYEIIDAEIQKDRYIQLADRVGKRLLYWFLKRPEPNSGWWKIIHELEECGWLVEYGDG